MALKLLVLFFTPLISGLFIYLVPKSRGTNFRLLLVFAGSYLFAITVIHILPELYQHNHDDGLIGLFVLPDFYFSNCWSILLLVLNMVISILRNLTVTIMPTAMCTIIAINLFLRSYFYLHYASMHF